MGCHATLGIARNKQRATRELVNIIPVLSCSSLHYCTVEYKCPGCYLQRHRLGGRYYRLFFCSLLLSILFPLHLPYPSRFRNFLSFFPPIFCSLSLLCKCISFIHDDVLLSKSSLPPTYFHILAVRMKKRRYKKYILVTVQL